MKQLLNKSECIFFDLDNTLLDHSSAEILGLQDTFMQYQLCNELELPMLLEKYKLINDRLWQQLREGTITATDIRTKRFYQLLLQEFDYGKSYAIQLAEDLGTYYLESYERHWQLYPFAYEVLEEAKKRIGVVGIITNGFTQQAKRKMNRFNLHDVIDSLIISSEVGVAKPDKRIFDIALQSVNINSPASAVYIGDHYEVDIVGAKSSGWKTIWFNPHEFSFDNPQQDFQVTTLKEIIIALNPH